MPNIYRYGRCWISSEKFLQTKTNIIMSLCGACMVRAALFLSLIALVGWGNTSLASEPLPAPTGPVILTITGNIQQTNAPGQARFDRAMLESFGILSLTTSSELSEKPQLFEGVSLRAVLDRIGARGMTMKASALNDYQADIPFEDLQYELLLALRLEGQPLKLRDKGPLWVVYPRDAHSILKDVRFDSRWVWQLNRLHVE
ncbi:molybdopterin-dependent oxidoreductase [Microvirga alba]|uniref:Molybdopterin-dependent oxidoreductase n=1 Tax=Microvirga alba TaxID=2791025 RepID=A0A931BS27_9HYPH|nr:molybdopterin-dependent oxidoreductase [Microvirga alba]MBF9234669.1 molybdopterin-dependent oxidoreductase [Microvirga alba]